MKSIKSGSKTIFNILIAAFMISSQVLLSSCGGAESEAGASKNDSAQVKPNEGGNTVEITKQQFASINLQMGKIEQKNLTSTLKATGFLGVPPQSKASITSPIGGTVQSIKVQEGDHVQKGQVVCTLINPEFIKMQEEFLDVQSQLAFSENEYNRQKELSEKNVASKKTFQEAESNYRSLTAKVNSLKQQLELLNINAGNLTADKINSTINIISPISGSVSHIDINIGSNAEASKTLLEVVDNSHLHLDLFVFEQDLPKVKEEQTVDFTLTNLPGKSFSAKIYSIGSAFENETKTIPIHAEITGDKNGLIEGMNVTGSINLGNNLVPAVLTSAIASFSGSDYVFIQTAGLPPTAHDHVKTETEVEQDKMGDMITFQRVQIKTGVTNGGYTEIIPLVQIPDTAKIVTNGAFYLSAILTNAGEEE